MPEPKHEPIPAAANDAQASQWSRDHRVQVIRRQLRLGHVEVACWSGFKPLRFPRTHLPYCHFLNEKDWDAVVDDWHGRV